MIKATMIIYASFEFHKYKYSVVFFYMFIAAEIFYHKKFMSWLFDMPSRLSLS